MFFSPLGVGTTMMISPTPATWAGMAFISTLDEVGGFATRHVDAHTIQRCHFLTQQGAIGVAIAPTLAAGTLLCLVVVAYTGGGGLQGLPLNQRQCIKRLPELRLRQFQLCQTARLQTIKTRRVVQHGGIATLLNVGQNFGHTLFNASVGFSRPMQSRPKIKLKAGAGGGQTGGGSCAIHGFSGSHFQVHLRGLD
jgi:hypothetical protein